MSLDSFMNKAYSVVNLLSLALGNETAAKRQIILSSDNVKIHYSCYSPQLRNQKQHKIMKHRYP